LRGPNPRSAVSAHAGNDPSRKGLQHLAFLKIFRSLGINFQLADDYRKTLVGKVTSPRL
jgi:hypothetical protein